MVYGTASNYILKKLILLKRVKSINTFTIRKHFYQTHVKQDSAVSAGVCRHLFLF